MYFTNLTLTQLGDIWFCKFWSFKSNLQKEKETHLSKLQPLNLGLQTNSRSRFARRSDTLNSSKSQSFPSLFVCLDLVLAIFEEGGLWRLWWAEDTNCWCGNGGEGSGVAGLKLETLHKMTACSLSHGIKPTLVRNGMGILRSS